MRRIGGMLLTASVIFSAGNAWGDALSKPLPVINSIQNLSNFYDPGRVSNKVQDGFPAIPKYAPRTTVTTPAAPATANAAQMRFVLRRVIIKGNTVFPRRVFGAIFRRSMRREISLADLQLLVHAVTKRYRDEGYILTRAFLPPQTIKGGLVSVRIVEGFVSNVLVQGDVGTLTPLLQRYSRPVKAARPLQIRELERFALLANDVPGVAVQTYITPSKVVPAGADLTVVVKRRRVSGFATFDNYGTRYIGPNETTVGASLYSLLVPGDSSNVRISTTTMSDEMRYLEFTHTQPLIGDGTRLTLGMDYTQTRPDFILKRLSIVGRSFLFFGDISYPIIRDRSENLALHATANYQNSTSQILGQSFYQDRIRSLDFGTNYDYTDEFHGVTQASMDFTHGFPVFGAHDHELQSRPKGQASYTRLNSSVSRLQGLSHAYSMFGMIKGQFTYQPLLATEQYGVGGPDIGRGYDASEIVGDNGVGGKVELRMDTYPNFTYLNAVEYYVFYDAGMVWNMDKKNLPGKQSLTSAGMGMRFTFMPGLTGNFYLARPLTHKTASILALTHNPNQPRGFFSLLLSS